MIPVYRSLDEIPAGFGPSIAAIGNFDGVHLGHQEILGAVVAEARARNAPRRRGDASIPIPEQVLRPERRPRLLTPMEERLRLLARHRHRRRRASCRSTRPWPTCRRGNLSSRCWSRRSAFAACTRAAISASGTAPPPG